MIEELGIVFRSHLGPQTVEYPLQYRQCPIAVVKLLRRQVDLMLRLVVAFRPHGVPRHKPETATLLLRVGRSPLAGQEIVQADAEKGPESASFGSGGRQHTGFEQNLYAVPNKPEGSQYNEKTWNFEKVSVTLRFELYPDEELADV